MYFSQKIPIIDPVHSVIINRHGVGQETASGYNWGVQGTQNGPKKGLKMTNFTLDQKLMKSNEIFFFQTLKYPRM